MVRSRSRRLLRAWLGPPRVTLVSVAQMGRNEEAKCAADVTVPDDLRDGAAKSGVSERRGGSAACAYRARAAAHPVSLIFQAPYYRCSVGSFFLL